MSTRSDGQVVIGIVADDKELEKSLRGAREKSADLGSELQRVNELLQLDPRNVELTKQKQELLTKSVVATKNELELLKKAQENAQAQFDRGEITEEQYRSLTREIAATEISLDGLNKELARYEKNGSRANASNEKLIDGATAMSAALAAAGTAMAALGAKVVSAATEYEAAFAKTRTIMDETMVSTAQMNADILALSTSSAMAAGDVSEAVYQAISGSVDTVDAVGFVNQANMLAVSGFTSLTNATDVLTTTLNAYGMRADQVMGISNVLIQTQNLGKTSVDELASSMGRAISTGSAYGVDLQNLSTAYVEMTRNGIATSEATTYLSGMLNELGNVGSTVGSILQEQTGQTFGQLMQDGWSLGDVLEVLSGSVNGNAEAFMGLWSSQEAGKGANAIMTAGVQDFNEVCAQMNAELQGTTGTTEKAYKTMTSTSEFIDKELNNSLKNLGIAIGEDLNPGLNILKQGLTDFVQGLTVLVNRHPAVSAALTGLTVGMGAMSIALAAYALKAKLATSETLKMTAAMATNPVFLAVGAIAALTVGVAAYAAASADAEEEQEQLTYSCRAQKEEIEQLTAEYEDLCESGKQASTEAQLLEQRIRDETAAFEDSKETMGEQLERWEKQSEARRAAMQEASDNTDAVELESEKTMNLVDDLIALTGAEEQNLATKERILAIVDLLNDRIPELGLSYNKLTGQLNMTPEEVIAAAETEARANLNAAKRSELIAAMETKILEEAAIEEQQANLRAKAESNRKAWAGFAGIAGDFGFDNVTSENAREIYGSLLTMNLSNERMNDLKGYYATITDPTLYDTSKTDEVYQKLRSSQEALDNANSIIAETSLELATYVEQEQEAIGDVSPLIDEYRAKLGELSEEYTNLYNASYESITGQFGLWEEAPEVVAMSIDDMIKATQSQQEYWDRYTANLDFVGSYAGQIEGLNDVIGMLSDGSEESASALAAIAQALQEGDITKVEDLVSSLQGVATAQKKAADAAAENATEYAQKVTDLAEQLAKDIEDMNIDATAYTLGNSAIEEFISGARDQEDAVQTAYRLLGETAYHALYESFGAKALPKNYSFNKAVEHTYAVGTASAAQGVALVGEEGPELVYFRGGERVLTAAETRAALSAVYPTVPDINYVGAGAPAIMRQGQTVIHVTVDTPLTVDGREFARGHAEYISEEIMGLM